MVDALVSNTSELNPRAGSTPALGTKKVLNLLRTFFIYSGVVFCCLDILLDWYTNLEMSFLLILPNLQTSCDLEQWVFFLLDTQTIQEYE